MTLGERLREIRKARGWSTRESAEASGLSLTYISDLEHGRGNPTLDALLALSRGYDMTLIEMLYPVTFQDEGGRNALPFEEAIPLDWESYATVYSHFKERTIYKTDRAFPNGSCWLLYTPGDRIQRFLSLRDIEAYLFDQTGEQVNLRGE